MCFTCVSCIVCMPSDGFGLLSACVNSFYCYSDVKQTKKTKTYHNSAKSKFAISRQLNGNTCECLLFVSKLDTFQEN